MDKYTKAVLIVIALSVLALPVKADEVLKCDGILYRLEKNLFSADTISVRNGGKWEKWCDSRNQLFELGDDAGRCDTTGYFITRNGKWVMVDGIQVSVLDFLQKKLSKTFAKDWQSNYTTRCYTFKKR